MEKPKILVVEDEKEIQELLTRFLSRTYNTFSSATAKEAVEVIKKEHPDIALLDIRLGDGSGLDVLKEIKQFDKNIKVIMVTVLCDEKTIHEAKTLGADDYVAKPVTMSYLNNLILEKVFELKLHKKIEEIKEKYL